MSTDISKAVPISARCVLLCETGSGPKKLSRTDVPACHDARVRLLAPPPFCWIMEPFYRRHLPHWRQDQATYFVTWRLARGQPELDSGERDLVAAAIMSFRARQYELAAYVVMDDHVHALVAPLPAYDLAGILHSWKSFTARQMQRKGKYPLNVGTRVWSIYPYEQI
jgi:REP element-mobilizing transposase RayT